MRGRSPGDQPLASEPNTFLTWIYARDAVLVTWKNDAHFASSPADRTLNRGLFSVVRAVTQTRRVGLTRNDGDSEPCSDGSRGGESKKKYGEESHRITRSERER